MNYYRKNREVLLQKAYDKYHYKGGKEKAANYYQENKEDMKKKERNKYKNMSEDKKNIIRERSKNIYYKIKRIKEMVDETIRKEMLSEYNIKDEVVKVFGGIEVTKKEFYENKKGLKLKDIIVNNIIVSEKVKVNNDILKYCIGYIVDNNVIPLILLLPIMSRWIKYLENGGKK